MIWSEWRHLLFEARLMLFFILQTERWLRKRRSPAVCFCSPGWQRALWVALWGWPCPCPSAAQRAACPVTASAEGRRALLERCTACSLSPSQYVGAQRQQRESKREGTSVESVRVTVIAARTYKILNYQEIRFVSLKSELLSDQVALYIIDISHFFLANSVKWFTKSAWFFYLK